MAVLAGGVAHAAVSGSVYCKSGTPSIQFAGRIAPDGGLVFGLSVWDPQGDNSFIHGRAEKRGDHWVYVAQKPEYEPSDPPCRLEIWYSERGGVKAKIVPPTGCANHDSWSEAGLTSKAYQGPVTVELDDPSNFFEEPPALLGKGDCFKQNEE